MNIRIESYKNISSISNKKYKQLMKLVDQCFPYVFADEDEIYLNFKENKIDLAFDGDSLMGFVSYNEDSKDIVNIDYLGVIQNKEYLNKGIATSLINNFIDRYQDKDLLLYCKADNDRARYLYHKLGFEMYGEGDSKFYGKMYQFALNTNKRNKNIASVLYELYKENQRRDDESLEETLMDMYKNKLYDNIYQYDMDEEEIDNVIANSKYFIMCVSILKEAINDGINKEDLFNKIESNLGLCLYNDVHFYRCMFECDKQEKGTLYKIFNLVRIKKIDDTLARNISVKK